MGLLSSFLLSGANVRIRGNRIHKTPTASCRATFQSSLSSSTFAYLARCLGDHLGVWSRIAAGATALSLLIPDMATQLYRTLTGQSQRSDHSGHSAQQIAPTPTNTSSTTDPLTGTLNHLTLKQEAALEEFKDRLEKQGWWVREVNNGKPSHDDGTLLCESASPYRGSTC